MHFADKQYGWAVGGSSEVFDAGIILNTIDGGITWKVNSHPAAAIGMGVFFTDRLHGYIVGSNPPFFDGVIMRTVDSGEHWEIQYLPCSWLNDILFTDDSTGWSVGDYGFLWFTKNCGLTWEKQKMVVHADLNRIIFVEAGKVGYIFGDDNTLLQYDNRTNAAKERNPKIPVQFYLYQNYPNPFNSQTKIVFDLKKAIPVTLTIYNLKGKEGDNIN